MRRLDQTKHNIILDVRARIAAGNPIGDETLPLNPRRIEVAGKSIGDLQLRVIYNDRAPYYFTVTQPRAA